MRVLRITGGKMKGFTIKIRGDIKARHTSSKIRESIFNIIDNIEGKSIIDLFSGSAILAFEAISRDADHVTIVEKDRLAVKNILENIKTLNLEDKCNVLNMDVFDAIPFLNRKGKVYDIVFMDPPYDKGYILKTLKELEENTIYREDTLFVVESSKREMLINNQHKKWSFIKQKRYGDTVLTVLKLKEL